MSLVFYSDHGMPGIVDSNDLHSVDGNRCAERLLEIASALEREGFEGVRVQCVPVEKGRFVHAVNTLDGSIGARLLKFIVDLMLTRKKLYSVDAALQIAKRIQEVEAKNE